MPDGLRYVISGILAGGIRGFRIVLCCFAHTWAWQDDVFWLLALLASVVFKMPCNTRGDTMLSPHNPFFTSSGLVTSNEFCFFVAFCLWLGLLLRCRFCFGSLRVVVLLDSDCCGLCTGPACQSTFCAPFWLGYLH